MGGLLHVHFDITIIYGWSILILNFHSHVHTGRRWYIPSNPNIGRCLPPHILPVTLTLVAGYPLDGNDSTAAAEAAALLLVNLCPNLVKVMLQQAAHSWSEIYTFLGNPVDAAISVHPAK